MFPTPLRIPDTPKPPSVPRTTSALSSPIVTSVLFAAVGPCHSLCLPASLVRFTPWELLEAEDSSLTHSVSCLSALIG